MEYSKEIYFQEKIYFLEKIINKLLSRLNELELEFREYIIEN